MEKIESFLDFLTSKEGPTASSDVLRFQELLNVLGKSTVGADAEDYNFLKEEDGENPCLKSFDSLLEWNDSLSPSISEEDDFEISPRKVNNPSKNPVSEEARNCFNASKSTYICPHCGTQRKNTRSMQQHLSWQLSWEAF